MAAFQEKQHQLTRKKNRHLEDDLQAACVQWFRLKHKDKIIMAIPNGGKRNIREAARLKKQGVLAGVPDLFIPYPTKYFHGMWIELKSPKGFPSISQIEMGERLYKLRYHVVTCRYLEIFIEDVELYLNESWIPDFA